MKKDFDGWNEEKKNLNDHEHTPHYREREIRWCRLGTNVGFEQDGTGEDRARPVLIVKGFSRLTCLIIPLTTSKTLNRYRLPIGTVGGRPSSAIISQLRLVDTKRLDQKITELDSVVFEGIRKAVKDML